MTAKTKKRSYLKKEKKALWLVIAFIFLLMISTSFLLQKHLYELQLEERLDKIEDTQDFLLTIKPQRRGTLEFQFSDNNVNYYFENIEQVYVSYGTTKIFLEEAIKRDLLDIKMILESSKKDSKENEKEYYTYEKKKEESLFTIKIERKDDQIVNVTFSV